MTEKSAKALKAALAAFDRATDVIASACIETKTVTIEKRIYLTSGGQSPSSAAFAGAEQSFMRESTSGTYCAKSGQAEMVFADGQKGYLGLTSYYDYNKNQRFNIRVFHPDFTIDVYPANCLIWQHTGRGTGSHPISWNNVLKQTHLEMLTDSFFSYEFSVGGEHIKEVDSYALQFAQREKYVKAIGAKFATIGEKITAVEKNLATAERRRKATAATKRSTVVTGAVSNFLKKPSAAQHRQPQG